MNRTTLVKLQKWTIWLALIGVIVLLRHLLPVIFLTFVITYIGNTLVNLLGARFRHRKVNVIGVFIVFLVVLASVIVLVVPRIFREARTLAIDFIAQEAPPEAGQETAINRQAREYVDTALIQLVGKENFAVYSRSEAYQSLLTRAEGAIQELIPRIVTSVRAFANASLTVLVQFFLSIILSFLILWDFPSLKAGVRSLESGPAGEVYREIAPSMTAFGVILGRAFEAQTGIALVNAILTSVGFLLLGIPSVALLAAIVFFCSYIPVVGVMLSTLPAALLAFTAGGITLVFWLVVMIMVVHAIEAYALNPLIYGRHLKMHPVAILVILLVGEHLFGIWGLLLGVPVAAYVLQYVLKPDAPESAAPVIS